MGIISSVASSVRKTFLDTFSSRSDTTGYLGIASDGSDWTAVNGTIEVKTGAAKSTTTPTSGSSGTAYPIATVTMPTQDNIISLKDTNEGSAIALWVQSSSDWWLVDVEGTQITNTNYATAWGTFASGTNYNVWSSFYNYYVVASYSTVYASYRNYTTAKVYNSSTNYTSTAYKVYGSIYALKYGSSTTYTSSYSLYTSPLAYNSSYKANYVTDIGQTDYYAVGNSNYSFYSYDYISGYSTVYSEYLKIKQSVSSVVNTITSALISTASTIKSLKVFTSGNQITARAYSDNNFVTQIGSDLVYTATGATITTKYGIGVSSSDYNQSAIIGSSVQIDRN